MTGYEPIVIDGIDCEIGWTNTDYGDYCEEHWAVLRHGCEIGKSIDRDAAMARPCGPCGNCRVPGSASLARNRS